MLKRKKINYILNISFILWLIIATIYNVITNPNITSSKASIEEMAALTTPELILSVIMIILFLIFMTAIQNIMIVIFFVAIKLGIKSAIKDKFTEIDLKKYQWYYREIINNYSPAVLGFINDFEINKDPDIAATLLGLKLKKQISITNKEIKLLNNSQNNIDENEKYILNNKNNFDLTVFKELVIKDSLKSNLIETQKDLKRKIKKRIISLIIIFVIFLILFFMLPAEMDWSNYHPTLVIALIMICAFIIIVPFIYLFFSVIYLFTYINANILSPYIRTKKGNEVNAMLKGLNNFIKDFGILDQRKKEELIIWDDYLIYSVLFNQNKNLIQELKQIYK